MRSPSPTRRVVLATILIASWTSWLQPLRADSVSGFSGSFSQAIAIEVPPFRGLEPQLALSYSSQGGGGFAGVGWGLAGFSVVQRMSPGFGAPRYDTTDIFVLNGQELIPCPAGNSPSCTSGGSHTTKNESYLKIKQDMTAANTWTIWAKNGTRTVLSAKYPAGQTFLSTFLWGQTSTVDTRNNTVTYAWYCDTLDCYPDSVTFGPYSVQLYREARPDVMTSAAGAGRLRQTLYRLLSILVQYQGSAIRGYQLSYAPSGVTARSLLTSVQQFGKDLTVNPSTRVISGVTSLPARTFQYQTDPGSGAFQFHPVQ
jgi:Salmonella virulence plasmid 65kDa B protein